MVHSIDSSSRCSLHLSSLLSHRVLSQMFPIQPKAKRARGVPPRHRHVLLPQPQLARQTAQHCHVLCVPGHTSPTSAVARVVATLKHRIFDSLHIVLVAATRPIRIVPRPLFICRRRLSRRRRRGRRRGRFADLCPLLATTLSTVLTVPATVSMTAVVPQHQQHKNSTRVATVLAGTAATASVIARYTYLINNALVSRRTNQCRSQGLQINAFPYVMEHAGNKTQQTTGNTRFLSSRTSSLPPRPPPACSASAY